MCECHGSDCTRVWGCLCEGVHKSVQVCARVCACARESRGQGTLEKVLNADLLGGLPGPSASPSGHAIG